MEIIIYIIAIGIVSAVMSFTITMSGLFKPLRDLIEENNKFFGDLFQCPHCLGYYICLFWTLLFFKSKIFTDGYTNIYDWILLIFVWFLSVGIMSICHKPILTAYDPVMKIKAQKALDKVKAENAKKRLEEELNK